MENEKPVLLSWHLEDALRDFGQKIAYRRAAWLADISSPAGRERNV